MISLWWVSGGVRGTICSYMSVRSRGWWWISDRARSYWHLSFRVKRWRWGRPYECACASTKPNRSDKKSEREKAAQTARVFMFSPAAEPRELWFVPTNLRVSGEVWIQAVLKHWWKRLVIVDNNSSPPSCNFCGYCCILYIVVHWFIQFLYMPNTIPILHPLCMFTWLYFSLFAFILNAVCPHGAY